jgi:hypothetical protein
MCLKIFWSIQTGDYDVPTLEALPWRVRDPVLKTPASFWSLDLQGARRGLEYGRKLYQRLWPKTLVSLCAIALQGTAVWSRVRDSSLGSLTTEDYDLGVEDFGVMEVQQLYFLGDLYIVIFFPEWRMRLPLSLSSINDELNIHRSPILATRTRIPFGIRGKRPRSILPLKRFDFSIHSIEELVTLGFLEP